METCSLMFCADPLSARRADPHFADEAAAAREAGCAIAFLDHDALIRGDAVEAVRQVPRGSGPWWYRGWMIGTPDYRYLADALAERDVSLAVSTENYRLAHELPGWYSQFADLTPPSVWSPTEPGVVPSAEHLVELVAPLGSGPAIVKDYVKSRKHEWLDACYVPDLADTNKLRRVVGRLIELQDDFLAGGVVVRRFEKLDAEELRVWWRDGRAAYVGAHPDSPDRVPESAPDLTPVQAAVARLGAPFVTTDLARRDDGVWRVVEVGDGQVSDRPTSIAPDAFLDALGFTR